ncbi:thymidylate kinase, partial [Candidatus Woesearchaeota archaeon]|nr:thymidylate kinase [Candidatus Woesearchaeota archaeon]
MKGKLIVIAGTDGSGKETQTEKLVDKLKNKGYPIET